MKHSDSPLDRLLRSAAIHRAAGTNEVSPPFGFSTRVVAGWLTGATRDGNAHEAGLQAMWMRRALLCAVAVMAVSVGWSFKTDTAAPNDEMTIASYDATADLQ